MRIIWCLFFVVGVSIVGHVVLAREFRAGVARQDITPPREMQASLGGYGDRMSRPAEGIHDRVYAKALVVAGGEGSFALVTADVLGFPPPVKKAVVTRLSDQGWTADRIMLLPSHSHTSIDMMQINPDNKLPIPQIGIFNQEVYAWTVRKIAQVIEDAAGQLEPASTGTSRKSLSGWNANRRRGGVVVDPHLTVTRIDKADGTPLAVLVNWTAHPTIMAAEDMLFSGGWPGHLQRTLEALIGHDVTVMYYNGAQGDQRPVARPDSGPSRWERAERYGRELALEVYGLWPSIETRGDAPVAWNLEAIDLPEPAAHADFRLTGGAEYGITDSIMQRILSLVIARDTSSGCLRLGDLLIVGIPGELAAGLGLDIKRQAAGIADVPYATIGGLANEWVSYILSQEEYERGGYEASVSFYGAGLGDAITQGALDSVKSLAGRQQR